MKHCTVIPIKDQKAMYVRGVKKCIQGPQYRVMLLMLKVSKSAYRVPQYRAMLVMSEVSKVHRELSIQSNVTHVKGVESSSICTIRAIMLMYVKGVRKKLKMVFTHLCS